MKQTLFSTGTLQTQRSNAALAPDYVAVDEKTIGDYLVFVKNYSSLIRYWNLQNSPEGTWQAFFNEDLSILLAYINHIDISVFPQRHDKISKAYQDTAVGMEKEYALIDLLLLILDISALIQDWYQKINEQSALDGNDNLIEGTIKELIQSNIWQGCKEMELSYRYMVYSFQQYPDITAGKDLSGPIKKTTHFYESILEKEQKGKDADFDFSDYQGFYNYLDEVYQSVYGVVNLIQQAIPDFLEQSLEQSNHTPHISLVLAFWKMLGESQQLMNQFTAKHLSFYYLDVLQQKHAEAIPDQVLLYFKLNPSQKTAFLPKGTAFVAGKSPEGKPLLYDLDRELAINQAQPVFYKSLYNGLAGQEHILSDKAFLMYAAPVANSKDGQGAKFLKKPGSWPPFGRHPEPGDTSGLAKMGFAISDSMFFLSEGDRSINIRLKFSEDTIDFLKQEFVKIGINDNDFWEALVLLIHRSFTCEYTAQKSWESPASFHTWLMTIDQGIGISFFIKINNTQPAVSAYNPKVHGTAYSTSDPIIRFWINQSVSIKKEELSKPIQNKLYKNINSVNLNPYALLSQLSIDTIPIIVSAVGVQDFSIQNDFSKLNPKKPYSPFGGTPIVNNHFYLGNNEIFRKPLDFLGLKIQWFDLPKLPNGFCDYYYDYNLFQPKKPFYNSVFKWNLDLLTPETQIANNKWQPLDFTAQASGLKTETEHPLDPADPNAAQELFTGLTSALAIPPPPQSLTPETAQKMLDKLGKHYGDNWTKNSNPPRSNSPSPPESPTDPPKESASKPKSSVKPSVVKSLLDKLGKHYGANWATNSPSTSAVSKSAPALNTDTATSILDKLGKHYGENWATNSPNVNEGVNPPLIIYKGNNFQGKPVIADTEFKPALDRIDQYAAKNKVKVHVTSSFRTSTQVKGAIVKPATRSNHMVGHAIDMNLIYNGDQWADSKYLNKANEDLWDPAVKGFINDIRNDGDLRWGGDFSTQDPVHIDDGLNIKDPKAWEKRYELTQAAWKAKPFENAERPGTSAPTDSSTNPQAAPDPLTIAQKLAKNIITQLNPPEESQNSAPDTSASANAGSNPTATTTSSDTTTIQPKSNEKQSKSEPDASRVEQLKDSIFQWQWKGGPSEKKPGTATKPETEKDKEPPPSKVEPLLELLKNGEGQLFEKDKKNSFLKAFENIAKERKKIHDQGDGILKTAAHLANEKNPLLSDDGTDENTNGSKDEKATPLKNGAKSEETTTDNPEPGQAAAEKKSKQKVDPATCPYKNEGELRAESLLLINDFAKINWSNLDPPTAFSTKQVYDDQTKDGYLRFTLNNPNYAFGNAEYPDIIAAVANHNMNIIASKIEKSMKSAKTNGGTESGNNSLQAKLKTDMTAINQFLGDNYLKLAKLVPGNHIKDSYKKAQAAAKVIDGILAKPSIDDAMDTLEKQFKIVMDFLYASGMVIHKLSSFFPEHKGKTKFLGGLFKSIFGHLPIIQQATNLLAATNPLIGAAVGLAKNITKKNQSKKKKTSIIDDYNAALTAVKGAMSLIKASNQGVLGGESDNIPKTTLLPPKPPYLPKIAKITANYSAQKIIAFKGQQSSQRQFYHIHPFGITLPELNQGALKLMPEYTEQGYFYIALNQVSTPENLTLLFVVNSNSGNRDLPLPSIQWSYLEQNQWIDFPAIAVKDGTKGFSQSGVIIFSLPYIDPFVSGLLTQDTESLYWLRATVSQNADAVCEIEQVYTQAGTATYAGADLDPAHYKKALAANKISKPLIPNAGITKVNQPLPSFGGRASEKDSGFYARVSERLRHKDRAVNAWDYEHLVLQNFPAISLVRCLNHTSLDSDFAPGNTALVILPDYPSEATISLAPKTNQGLIGQVTDFLKQSADPFSRIHVRNPAYEFLQVQLEIVLQIGLDPGHYLKVLNDALIEKITPWRKNFKTANPFKNSISYYHILEFIEQQSYVKEVGSFKLLLLKSQSDPKGKSIEKSFDPIEPEYPWIIISSVEQHLLKAISEQDLMRMMSDRLTTKSTEKAATSDKLIANIAKDTITEKTESKPVLNALYIGNDLYNTDEVFKIKK